MNYSSLGWMLTGISLTLGCATVRSSTKQVDALAPGITYYLPMREVKVTAERKLLKQEELRKALATKTTEHESINALIKTLEGAIATARERLKAHAVQADTGAKAAVSKELAIATADLEIAKARRAAVATDISILEASLRILESAPPTSCALSYSAAVELLAPVADARHRFVADLYHSPLRDDNVKLAVNSSGLLSTANVVAADRTGDVLVEIASAVSGLGVGGLNPKILHNLPADTATVASCAQQPSKFAYRLDPASPEQVKLLNSGLYSAGFPFLLEVPPMNGGTGQLVSVANATAKGKGSLASGDDAFRQVGKKGALFYRTALPQTIVLRQCSSGTACQPTEKSVSVEATMTMLPQVGPISYIPMKASSFVKTVDDVVFENGMILSWNAVRPSGALAVVRMPVGILKAIISVPAEIIKLRVDLTDQERGLAASQQAQIEAAAKLAKIQACVDAAGDNRDAAMECFRDK